MLGSSLLPCSAPARGPGEGRAGLSGTAGQRDSTGGKRPRLHLPLALCLSASLFSLDPWVILPATTLPDNLDLEALGPSIQTGLARPHESQARTHAHVLQGYGGCGEILWVDGWTAQQRFVCSPTVSTGPRPALSHRGARRSLLSAFPTFRRSLPSPLLRGRKNSSLASRRAQKPAAGRTPPLL